jgi:hypothetical protein
MFIEMYRSHRSLHQDIDKINFGKYKSTGGDGIPIEHLTYKSSVVVTAGGRILVEELIT